MAESVTREEFEDVFLSATERYHDAFVLLAPLHQPGSAHHGEHQPVGFVGVNISDHRMEPHVEWLEWATPRNKLEAATKFLVEMGKSYLVLPIILLNDQPAKKFYTMIMKMGVLDRVGNCPDWYGPGQTASIFRTRGLKDD